jgi:hypothetical protein
VTRIRIVLGAAGIALALFGVFRLVTQISFGGLAFLALWLVGALVLHDGIVSPGVLGLGALISRKVPPRARRYLQGALIAAAAVTVIALPMIYRAHSQPKVKALLEQNFAANLALLVGVIAVVAILGYVVRLVRDHTHTAGGVAQSAAQQPGSETEADR